MKSLKYTYLVLFWISICITMLGFYHFVETLNFVIFFSGLFWFYGSQEFYLTYENEIFYEDNPYSTKNHLF